VGVHDALGASLRLRVTIVGTRCTLRPVGRAVRLSVVLAVCALALPCAASAEPIVTLGTTAGPASAVTDGAGTLHAVWHTYEQQGGPDMLSYCRIPAGGTTCTPTILGGFPSIVVGDPRLLLRRQDGALIIVVPGNDDQARNVTFLLASIDGGATWSGPTIAGIGMFDVDHAVLTPDGGAVDTLEDFVTNMSWQRVPISSPPTPPETRIVSLTAEPNGRDTSFNFSGNLGYRPDGRPMIVAYSPNDPGGNRYRVLRAGADPYVNGSWTPWSAAPRLGGISVVTAFGPNGIWAMTHDSILAGMGLKVWRFDGHRFERPWSLGTIGGRATTNVLGDTPVAGGAYDFAQDAGGRLHAAWSNPGLCGLRRQCLLYRRNEPRGFGPPVVYPLPTGVDQPRYLTLAPNEGGSGWMVWRAGFGDSPSFATALATPPRGSRIGSRRIGRSRRVTVPTHYACIAPGGRFVHRALVSGRRRGVTIVSVRFSFDGGQLARTDHRAPYRIVYRLSFPAGTRHVAEARVTYRLNGRTRHTSVGRAIVMCP
jgi:hypothetical protein